MKDSKRGKKLREVSLDTKAIFVLKAFVYPEKASVKLSDNFGGLMCEDRIHSLLPVKDRDSDKPPFHFEWDR